MTVVEFKRRMQAAKETGKPVACKLYWRKKETGEYYLVRDYGERKVTIVQSNRYAMETEKLEEGKPVKLVNSWGDFPKAAELITLADNRVECLFDFGKIEVTFQ